RQVEPVYQLTCRDRNRIVLQSDLLTAYSLGIDNVLLLTGDPIQLGDHKEAKPVFDLDSVQLIDMAMGLRRGRDITGMDR
ncbi:MAG: methylenetetrahydrofolate reductase, partial [Desulfobacterales bacterium]